MSTSPSLCTSSHVGLRRRRLVIDPIWKVVDIGDFNRTWECLTRECQLYGFVGFDMEWTTKLVIPDAGESAGHGASEAAATSSTRKPRRWTGPVATIQLSTYSCTVVVRWSHLHALVSGNACELLFDPYASISASWPAYRLGQKLNPPTVLRRVYSCVKELIASPHVFLVGVGIHGDEVKLRRDYPKITAQSAVELTALAEACLPDTVEDRSQRAAGTPPTVVRTDSLQSLKKLCAALTGRELGKDMAVVMSDWGGCCGALTPLQIAYSADDAEASYDVCVAILRGGGFLVDGGSADGTDSPASPAGPWTVASGLDCREVLACCTTAADGPPTSTAAVTTPPPLARRTQGAEEAETRWCKGRAKPYYDNINVYSPNMELVFTVDKAKAEWYVNKKGLATVIEWRTASPAAASPGDGAQGHGVTAAQEMAAIQLRFAPDFARYNDSHIRRNLDYFKQPKLNVCVVCGGGGSLVRFAVVPLMYRRFFPSVYMSHNSYDLLLLCPRCFTTSRQLYDRLRAGVADDFAIPLIHLRGEQQQEAYARRVQEMSDSIDALSRSYEAAHASRTAAAGTESTAVDCDLHPRLRLQSMQDCLALMQHRERLDRIFSYAKALNAHYESLHVANTAETEAATSATTPSSVPPGQGGARRQPRRRHTSSQAGKVTAIPEERRRMMAEYLCEHAPLYPFFAGSLSSGGAAETPPGETAAGSGGDGAALQSAAFDPARGGPASRAGVRFILRGAGDGARCPDDAAGVLHPAPVDNATGDAGTPTECVNTSRGVLTRFWLRTHPELLELLPAFTRMEERQRAQAGLANEEGPATGADQTRTPSPDPAAEGDQMEVPYVDSHAFLVVLQLLKKYALEPAGGRTCEHAVGQFIYRWRSAFVKEMTPQYLPAGWVPEDGILR